MILGGIFRWGIVGVRRRAVEAELGNVHPYQADMEVLPFGDGVFDCVVCKFGLMFCPRVEVAVSEALRVLKPGGRVACMVWGPIEENTIGTPRNVNAPRAKRCANGERRAVVHRIATRMPSMAS